MDRRTFLIAGTALAAAPAPTPTAAQIIDRIRKNVGVPWRAQTVDNVIAGNPDTPVRGIATTMMATLDVLQRAATAGHNLVITHEPTFYLHQDETATLANNPVYKFKLDFIRQHDMVIFRFHDHWHAHHPDGIALGMSRDLGWERNVVDPADPREFTFPATPLVRFAQQIAERLHIRTMRVVGDPALPVHRVATSWGYLSRDPGIQLLARPDVDVAICGETREWEVVEYAQDAIAAGQKKALIVMGHVVSEQSGMRYCAEWLKSFVTEVPVQFIPAPEPFWLPSLPPDPAAS
ncbi:MAG: Nif3-like dinuclear metal center hexameric protein [Bryobacteraceae bacterium]|jgi:putative NIF3 family GTP cyclohydrolase 1 type 2